MWTECDERLQLIARCEIHESAFEINLEIARLWLALDKKVPMKMFVTRTCHSWSARIGRFWANRFRLFDAQSFWACSSEMSSL